MRTNRITTAIAAGVMAATLVACGTSSSDTGTRDLSGARRIVSGYDVARDERSVRMAGEVSVRTPSRDLTVPLDGAIDFTNDAARFTISLGDLGLPAVGAGSIEARAVDGRLYVRVGDLAARLLGGNEWIEVPVGAMGGASTDPTGFLDALRGVAKVERVGTDTIRGVEATHYRGTIDLAAAIERAPEARRDDLRRALGGSGTLPVDVWVDAEDRPVRFVATFGANGVEAEVRLDLFDYGADVSVTAPPADDVTSLDGMFGGLTGGSGTTSADRAPAGAGPTANA